MDVVTVVNKTIWKWKLRINGTQVINMPSGAEVLSIQTQQGSPVLWALVNEDNPLTSRTFATYGTGFIMPENPGKYIGSYQNKLETLVFHVFEQEVVE